MKKSSKIMNILESPWITAVLIVVSLIMKTINTIIIFFPGAYSIAVIIYLIDYILIAIYSGVYLPIVIRPEVIMGSEKFSLITAWVLRIFCITVALLLLKLGVIDFISRLR